LYIEMPELGGFAQIAPYLTNPLVLAGFGLLLFFGLLRAVLKSRVMPTVSQTAGGRALASLLRYGFVVALVVIVLGFALAYYRTERETVDVDAILEQLLAAKEAAATHEARAAELERALTEGQEERKALRAAVAALADKAEEADAPPKFDQALAALAEGQTEQAEQIFAEIVARKAAEGAAANREAAEAARHLGALAYLDDTRKAIEAYQTATRLDPDDTWSWILLGRLYQRAGNLASAEQAFQKARDVAERSGNGRDDMAADHGLGDVRVARGDLSGAAAAYEAGLAAAKQRAAQDPSNTEWRRDLSVTFDRIGDVQRARGNLEAALQAYQDGLAIREQLAAQD
jgi:tetratricopeptide (TPR) repeat protein